MLYKGADLIRDVEFVIFDEVHYVNDAEVRGESVGPSKNAECLVARGRLGGGHYHAPRSCQHYLALSHCSKHKGVRGLGGVSTVNPWKSNLTMH